MNPTHNCVPSNGSAHGDGYFTIRRGGKSVLHHRAAYRDAHPEEDITGKHIRHRCHNKACVNPEHLASGTAKDNRADSVWDGSYAFPVLHGEDNPAAKITQDIVDDIRQHCADGRRGCQAEMVRKHGLTRQHVSDIVRRKRWVNT